MQKQSPRIYRAIMSTQSASTHLIVAHTMLHQDIVGLRIHELRIAVEIFERRAERFPIHKVEYWETWHYATYNEDTADDVSSQKLLWFCQFVKQYHLVNYPQV